MTNDKFPNPRDNCPSRLFCYTEAELTPFREPFRHAFRYDD